MMVDQADTATTLQEVNAAVQAAAREKAESYIPSRYPYTYACDFLRAHTHLLPDGVFEVVKPVSSRADAALARETWAAHIGFKDGELAIILADGYLTEHGIPLGDANLERGEAFARAHGIEIPEES